MSIGDKAFGHPYRPFYSPQPNSVSSVKSPMNPANYGNLVNDFSQHLAGAGGGIFAGPKTGMYGPGTPTPKTAIPQAIANAAANGASPQKPPRNPASYDFLVNDFRNHNVAQPGGPQWAQDYLAQVEANAAAQAAGQPLPYPPAPRVGAPADTNQTPGPSPTPWGPPPANWPTHDSDGNPSAPWTPRQFNDGPLPGIGYPRGGIDPRVNAGGHPFQYGNEFGHLTAADNLRDITSQESPLMHAARTEGLKLANRRGMLNSSMAADASQDAMIRNAAPIAQQDADNAMRRWLFDADAGLRTQLQANEFNFNAGQNQLNRDLQEMLEGWRLDSTDMANASQFLTNMEAQFTNQYNSILANPNMSAEDRTKFLESAKNLRDVYLHFVEQLYQVELDW